MTTLRELIEDSSAGFRAGPAGLFDVVGIFNLDAIEAKIRKDKREQLAAKLRVRTADATAYERDLADWLLERIGVGGKG